MTHTYQVLIYEYVKQLPDTHNRSQRRQVQKERKMIVEKLDRIALNHEMDLLTDSVFSNDGHFLYYNEQFQAAADLLSRSIRFHAIHRGWFYMMYKPERIGIMRDEERKSNALSNWTMETIAIPFLQSNYSRI
jgi:CCR4-NOT transcriptional regulation complex NOT5 subunit